MKSGQEWDDNLFQNWISLRAKFRSAKREKDHPAIIAIGMDVIALSERASFIGIVNALFEYDIAEAHIKSGDTLAAVKYYRRSLDSFQVFRSTKKLRNPDDFLSDIEKIQKKLMKLEDLK